MGRREFGTIRRLPSGRWQASYWCDGNRHFASHTFRTKRSAGEYLSAIETELRRGDWIDPLNGRILLADLAEEWTATIVDLRPSTKARDLGYLNRYVLPRFGHLEVRAITHVMVSSWVAELDGSGLAPSTTTKAVHILAKILRFAVRARVIPSSPCDGVRLPRIERNEMRFLTTVVDVGGHLHFGPPKTRAGTRIVPLPRVAADPLADHLTAYARSPDELVFHAPGGGPVQLNLWRQRFWAPAVKKAGLVHLRPHDLRHTAVALWIAAGANPKEVASRAGHSSVSFALDRYGHLFPGSEQKLNDALDALADESRAAVISASENGPHAITAE